MQQEDWFMKQINLLGRVLGKILADLLGLKARGKVGEGIEAAEQTFISELDLNIDELILIPVQRFINTLQEQKNFNDEDLEKLADIFFLIAEEFGQRGKEAEKTKELFGRSLIIYEYLDKTGSTYSFDRHTKIEKIKNQFR
jgi:hypothetical protein